MMNDGIVPAKSRIFILDCMQTVRTSCHNSIWLYCIQNFNICRSQTEENIFPSGAASRISVTLLVLSEDRIINPGRIQNFGKGLGGLLGTRVGGGGAPDPPQEIGFRILFDG